MDSSFKEDLTFGSWREGTGDADSFWGPTQGASAPRPTRRAGWAGSKVCSLRRCGRLRGRRRAAAGAPPRIIRASFGIGTGKASPARHDACKKSRARSGPPDHWQNYIHIGNRNRWTDDRDLVAGQRFGLPGRREGSEQWVALASDAPSRRIRAIIPADLADARRSDLDVPCLKYPLQGRVRANYKISAFGQ
jgi:hypothetical protein